jgi:hypothetical protein
VNKKAAGDKAALAVEKGEKSTGGEKRTPSSPSKTAPPPPKSAAVCVCVCVCVRVCVCILDYCPFY